MNMSELAENPTNENENNVTGSPSEVGHVTDHVTDHVTGHVAGHVEAGRFPSTFKKKNQRSPGRSCYRSSSVYSSKEKCLWLLDSGRSCLI